jgi:hypothetical protein
VGCAGVQKQLADLPDRPISAGGAGRDIALLLDFVYGIGNGYREPRSLQDR